MTTPQTSAPEWTGALATPWTDDTVARRIFDAFSMRTTVKDRNLTEPPLTCSDGDRYLVASPAAGAWVLRDGNLAIAVGANAIGGWIFVPIEREGMQVWVEDEAAEINYRSGMWQTSAANARRLQDLTDVDLTGLGDGMVLKYDASNGFFTPAIENDTPAASAFRGALVTKASDQTGANFTSGGQVAWDSEVYDTDGFHDNVTNNTRITIPSGVSKVRLQAAIRFSALTVNLIAHLRIYENGTDIWAGSAHNSSLVSLTDYSTQIETPVIDVVAGDYFEVRLVQYTDTSITIVADRSWFAIEVIE